MLYLVILIFFLITSIQSIIFIKRKLIKELIVSLVLIVIAFTYAVNGVTDWNLPSPNIISEFIYDSISNTVFTDQQK